MPTQDPHNIDPLEVFKNRLYRGYKKGGGTLDINDKEYTRFATRLLPYAGENLDPRQALSMARGIYGIKLNDTNDIAKANRAFDVVSQVGNSMFGGMGSREAISNATATVFSATANMFRALDPHADEGGRLNEDITRYIAEQEARYNALHQGAQDPGDKAAFIAQSTAGMATMLNSDSGKAVMSLIASGRKDLAQKYTDAQMRGDRQEAGRIFRASGAQMPANVGGAMRMLRQSGGSMADVVTTMQQQRHGEQARDLGDQTANATKQMYAAVIRNVPGAVLSKEDMVKSAERTINEQLNNSQIPDEKKAELKEMARGLLAGTGGDRRKLGEVISTMKAADPRVFDKGFEARVEAGYLQSKYEKTRNDFLSSDSGIESAARGKALAQLAATKGGLSDTQASTLRSNLEEANKLMQKGDATGYKDKINKVYQQLNESKSVGGATKKALSLFTEQQTSRIKEETLPAMNQLRAMQDAQEVMAKRGGDFVEMQSSVGDLSAQLESFSPESILQESGAQYAGGGSRKKAYDKVTQLQQALVDSGMSEVGAGKAQFGKLRELGVALSKGGGKDMSNDMTADELENFRNIAGSMKTAMAPSLRAVSSSLDTISSNAADRVGQTDEQGRSDQLSPEAAALQSKTRTEALQNAAEVQRSTGDYSNPDTTGIGLPSAVDEGQGVNVPGFNLSGGGGELRISGELKIIEGKGTLQNVNARLLH